MSGDVTDYVDLRVYDKDPEDILAAALAVLQTNLPEWVPSETNIETLLLQALAIEVADAVFTVNRLPSALMEIMLGLMGVQRDVGAAPMVDVEFSMADTDGYVIPAGTQVALTVGGSDTVLTFATDADLSIIAGDLTGIVSATCTVATDVANGTATGTALELVTSVEQVEDVTTASQVSGGAGPESDQAFLTRGASRLQRLTDSLVAPQHFETAALEQTYVTRCTVFDNYDPLTGPDPGDNAGHVTVYVYGAGGLLNSGQKDLLYDTLYPDAAANLAIHVEDAVLSTVDVAVTVVRDTRYTVEQVVANIDAALDGYLTPESWPWRGTVYVNELISLVDSTTGVDRVVSVDDPASDLTIGLDNVLVTLGTVMVSLIETDGVALSPAVVAGSAAVPAPTVSVP